jgi:selenide,water dikinase
VWSNRAARPGQVLVLTKALGTGVIGQAIKHGVASDAATLAASRSMMILNQTAARIGRAYGTTAATDVTGFGLLGHLRNIVRGSRVAATIELDQLPLLPDAKEQLRAAMCPGGSRANRAHVAPDTVWADATPLAVEGDGSERDLLASLACDAQTSGGLLLCIPAANAEACVVELRTAGLPAARIGSITEYRAGAPITLR